jgi:SAM-dependent methyltransferase
VPEVDVEKILLFREECARHFDPETGELRHPLRLAACPVCDSKKLKHQFTLQGFRYLRCSGCRFMFVNPRLNDAGSAEFYNSPFYNALVESEYYRVQNEDQLYYSSSVESNQLMEMIVGTVGRIVQKDARILDVGCGGGALLRLLKDRLGLTNLLGIDLNGKAARFAKEVRGVNVIHGDAKHDLQGRQFDLVLSIESIEHMNDFKDYMRMLLASLVPGGQLLITTPRNSRLACFLFGQAADGYMAPNHINFFDDRNLKAFLERFGLRVTELQMLSGARSAGLLYRRFLAESEYVAYQPPVSGPSWVILPRNLRGDVRRYIRDRYAYVSNGGGSGDLSAQSHERRPSLLRRLVGLFSIPIKTNMLMVARKD